MILVFWVSSSNFKFLHNRIGQRNSKFYCLANNKRINTTRQCDGTDDCQNNNDERYCRLNKKYNGTSYTNNQIKQGTTLRGGKLLCEHFLNK